MRVALVHDYLNQYGGAERVLEALAKLFPKAPIFTLLYDERRTHGAFKDRQVIPSGLQKIPGARHWHRGVVWLMPTAVEQFDLHDFDVVISDSASFAKGVITRPSTLHICYCHTPLRYAWTDHARWRADFRRSPAKLFIPLFQNYLRLWDYAAAQRVDAFLANSHAVAKRIKRYYNRDSHVIYPPVDVEKFRNPKSETRNYNESRRDKVSGFRFQDAGTYYLVVSRLLPYKSVDLAVKAFNVLGLPLKVVGDGPERRRLEKMARPNIKFLGGRAPHNLAEIYAGAKALIFPQEEDFGLVAVEALAAGTPVIGFNAGGLPEIVRHNEHGLLFNKQTPESLAEAVRQLEHRSFDRRALFSQAQQFSAERFSTAFMAFLNDRLRDREQRLNGPNGQNGGGYKYRDKILE